MAIAGFLASVTLDGTIYAVIVSDFEFDRSRAALEKNTMDGTGFAKALPGIQSGTVALAGHVDSAEWNTMEATLLKEDVVPFVIEATEGLTTDMKWAGNVAVTDVNVNVDTQESWAFSFTGTSSGAWTYTPAVP